MEPDHRPQSRFADSVRTHTLRFVVPLAPTFVGLPMAAAGLRRFADWTRRVRLYFFQTVGGVWAAIVRNRSRVPSSVIAPYARFATGKIRLNALHHLAISRTPRDQVVLRRIPSRRTS